MAIVYPSSGWKWGVPSFDIDSDFLELEDDEEEGEGWIKLRSRISGVFGSIDESRWVMTIVSWSLAYSYTSVPATILMNSGDEIWGR